MKNDLARTLVPAGMAIALAMGLAACGGSSSDDSDDDNAMTINSPDGSVVIGKDGNISVTSSDGSAIIATGDGEASLPDGITVYPGARVIMNISGDEGAKRGGVVTMETTDSADQVIAYYRDEIEDVGLEIHTNGMFSGSQVVAARDEAEDFGISVSASDGGDNTQVQIAYGENR